MRYLVTGATGFIGTRLVRELLSKGDSVVVLSRDPERAGRRLGSAVTALEWDPPARPAPKEAFASVDAVIHLAGEGIADNRWTEKQKKRIHDSRALGTRNLVTTLRELREQGPKVFVSASAIGYYGDRGDEMLVETSRPGNDFLSRVCVDWEEEARQAPPTIRRVVIRIGIVLGKEGGALKKMLPIFRLGLGGPVGSGNQWMSWIHIDDLVALFIRAATDDRISAVVNGVAPNPVPNAAFAKALGRVLGRPAMLPAPAFALKALLGELSVLVLEGQRVRPEAALKSGFAYRFPTVDAALADIVGKAVP